MTGHVVLSCMSDCSFDPIIHETFFLLSDDSIVFCPPNMKYGNCTCQATCEDPYGRRRQITCNEEEIYICQEGFLRKGDECILPKECGCFIDGKGVISVVTFSFKLPPWFGYCRYCR